MENIDKSDDDLLKILFVGEEPSKTAIEKAWKWGDDHLCSKTLEHSLTVSQSLSS